MLGTAKPGTPVGGYDGGTGQDLVKYLTESFSRRVKLLSPGDADDRSPSRIRGMFQVVWLMVRDTS